MASKLLDGRNFTESTLDELVAYSIQLAEDHADGDRTVVKVTDARGNALERIKLFAETLTDGSKVFNVELHFGDHTYPRGI